MVWIWQLVKRTDDYKIILNLCKKIDEKTNKSEKEAGKGTIFKKIIGQARKPTSVNVSYLSRTNGSKTNVRGNNVSGTFISGTTFTTTITLQTVL
jgi:hypothetical protein